MVCVWRCSLLSGCCFIVIVYIMVMRRAVVKVNRLPTGHRLCAWSYFALMLAQLLDHVTQLTLDLSLFSYRGTSGNADFSVSLSLEVSAPLPMTCSVCTLLFQVIYCFLTSHYLSRSVPTNVTQLLVLIYYDVFYFLPYKIDITIYDPKI